MIPASYAAAFALFNQIGAIKTIDSSQTLFLYGVGFYAFLHTLIFKPAYLYVLGHEITHVLATWICAGRVSSFSVSSKGGSVKTSKSNFFIALAPYLFPFYTIFFSLIFGLMWFIYRTSFYVDIFMFIVGFTLAFHFIMTVQMIKKKQPDIIKTGYLFSGNLVFLVNIVIFMLILSLLFKEVNLAEFFNDIFSKTAQIYTIVFHELF
jgi:hypothetical protein